jgi:hypothetical protein
VRHAKHGKRTNIILSADSGLQFWIQQVALAESKTVSQSAINILFIRLARFFRVWRF